MNVISLKGCPGALSVYENLFCRNESDTSVKNAKSIAACMRSEGQAEDEGDGENFPRESLLQGV